MECEICFTPSKHWGQSYIAIGVGCLLFFLSVLTVLTEIKTFNVKIMQEVWQCEGKNVFL